MCASQILSPIASSAGRSALLGGVAGAALSTRGKDQKQGMNTRADWFNRQRAGSGSYVAPQAEKTPGP